MQIRKANLQALLKKAGNQFLAWDDVASNFNDEMSGFEIWSELNNQIGRHQGNLLQSHLVKVRDAFVDDFVKYERDRLDAIFKESRAHGTEEWLVLVITSISQFNDLFQTRFCKFDFPFAEKYNTKISEVKTTVDYINNDCWADAYPTIEFLSNLEFISTDLRVHMLVILGEIQLYRFAKKYKADILFCQAEESLPEHYRVLSSKGSYYFSLGEIEKSREYFEKLKQLYPNRGLGYTGIAEIMEMRKETPEIHYQDALENAPGEVSPYLNLLRYYVRGDSENNKAKIEDLKKRLLLISPESEYSFHIEMGIEFKTIKKFDKAIAHYERAIVIDKSLSRGYFEMGYTFVEIHDDSSLARACENFAMVIAILPNSISGYWAMAYALTAAKNYTAVLDWYNKCPTQVVDYNDKIFAAKSDAYRNLKNYEAAEQELLNAFAIDNQSDWARAYAEILAQEYYEVKKDRESAFRLYELVLHNFGDAYKANYENRIGNVFYYFQEFHKAADHYRNAIDKNPGYIQFQKNLALACNSIGNNFFGENKFIQAIANYKKALELDSSHHIYYSNLAKAYEEENDLDNALKQLQKASEISPEGYIDKIQALKAKRELLPIYGQKSLKYIPVVTPIAVEAGGKLSSLLSTGSNLNAEFQTLVTALRDELQERFGHEKIPGIRVRANEDLAESTYVIIINEIPLVTGTVRLDCMLCDKTVGELARANIKAEKAINPYNGVECAWIPIETLQAARNMEFKTWDSLHYIILHLSAVLSKNFSEFVTIQTVAQQLSQNGYSQRVTEMEGGIPRFTNALKALVEEEVPIKEFDIICEAYIDLTLKDHTLFDIVEGLRNDQNIKASILGNQGASPYCPIYNISDEIAELVYTKINTNGDGSWLAIEPELTQQILAAVRNEVTDVYTNSEVPVIMTKDWKIRRHVRKLVELEFPHLAVMAQREMLKEPRILGTIGLDG